MLEALHTLYSLFAFELIRTLASSYFHGRGFILKGWGLEHLLRYHPQEPREAVQKLALGNKFLKHL